MTVSIYEYTVPPLGREGLPESPTLSVGKRVAADKVQDKNSVAMNFGVGELNVTPTKEEVQEWDRLFNEAHEVEPANPLYQDSANSGKRDHNKYTAAAGTPGLRHGCAVKFMEDTGVEELEGAKHVVVGGGAKPVLAHILRNSGLLIPGDKVVMATPGWPSQYAMVPPGVTILEVDTGGTGLITAEQMQEVLKDYPDTKAIVINNPCNPTGQLYTAEEREEVMAVIHKHAMQYDAKHEKQHGNSKFMLVCDNPYGKLVFDGSDLKFGKNEKALFDSGNMTVIKSFSKEYGLPGPRIGYAISKNKDHIKSVNCDNEQLGGNTGAEAMDKAQRALLFGDAFIEKTRDDLKKRCDIYAEVFENPESHGVFFKAPQGTMYAQLDFAGWIGKTINGQKISKPGDIDDVLFDEAKVEAVPGHHFSVRDSDVAKNYTFRRFSLAQGTPEQLKAALERVRALGEKIMNPPEMMVRR